VVVRVRGVDAELQADALQEWRLSPLCLEVTSNVEVQAIDATVERATSNVGDAPVWSSLGSRKSLAVAIQRDANPHGRSAPLSIQYVCGERRHASRASWPKPGPTRTPPSRHT